MEQQDGFAAVDALVALTLLAITLSLAMEAAGSARRLGAAALQTRRATALLQYLQANAPAGPGKWSGQAAGMNWRLEAKLLDADPQANALRLCRRAAEVRDGPRRFALASTAFCKAPAPAAAP
jgi:hypothetical protein